MAGNLTEYWTSRGYQSFWNITNEEGIDRATNYNIDATGIGMSFNYNFTSKKPIGNCSFDANGESLVSLSDGIDTYHMLVQYTVRNGFGEYWLGHSHFLPVMVLWSL